MGLEEAQIRYTHSRRTVLWRGRTRASTARCAPLVLLVKVGSEQDLSLPRADTSPSSRLPQYSAVVSSARPWPVGHLLASRSALGGRGEWVHNWMSDDLQPRSPELPPNSQWFMSLQSR